MNAIGGALGGSQAGASSTTTVREGCVALGAIRGTKTGCGETIVGLEGFCCILVGQVGIASGSLGGCGIATRLFLAREEAAERRFAHGKRLEIGGPCVRFERFGCNDAETSESYSDRFKRRPGAGSRDMSLPVCLLLGLVALLCWAFGQDAIGIWRGDCTERVGGGGPWMGGYSWSV